MIGRIFKQLLFASITVIISVVVLDLVLNGAARVVPKIDDVTSIIKAKIPDDKLGKRPNPRYPGHDANGFRNPTVPERATVVALGDSHTYGSGVASAESWPKVLEQLAGEPVYNMGLGGYGALHSRLLWDEAMQFQPDIVIDGIYAGNDLYDAFSLVYNQNKATDYKNPDQATIDSILQAEAVEPIGEYVGKMYRRGRVKSQRYRAVKAWLEDNSRVYGILKRFQLELRQIRDRNKPKTPSTPEKRWAKAQKFANKFPDYAQEFSDGTRKTIFTAEYRLAALNLEDPRIIEGQRITYEAVKQMDQLARANGIRYIVLFIPSKELVFAEAAKDLDSDNYHQLVRYEQQFWQETRQFLEQQAIEYVDGLAPLRQQLETGPQSYKVNHNGHPNAHGQQALAESLHRFLN